MENKNLIKKWLNDELDSHEMAILQKTREYQQYKDIIENASKFRKPQFNPHKGLENLKYRLSETKDRPVRKLFPSVFIKVAAVLAVIVASGIYLYLNQAEVVSTGYGEKIALELPDRSTVKLNAGSQIKYDPSDWDKQRMLQLDGEAFFVVEKGKSFRVRTEQGSVSVLGTRFNVKERDNYFEVSCYEGAVKVTTANKEVILQKGQAVKLIAGELQKVSKIDRSLPGWTIEESEFDAVPLLQVIEEVERQFDLQIKAKNVDLDQLFTGSFGHSDKEVALKAITVPLGLKYAFKSGNQVILYEEE